MKRHYSRYTDAEIIEAIEATPNFTQAAQLLGINRKTVIAAAQRNKIQSKNLRVPDHDAVLVVKSERDGNIPKYIRKHSLLVESCLECGLSVEWNGKSLVLQLDHINGLPGDNRIENLRWLCPNCHSQTETFCGKNFRR